jgi:hypothetical protein
MSPDWDAVTEQVPDLSKVRVEPSIVQIVGEFDLNVRDKPLEELATRFIGRSVRLLEGGRAKVMVCEDFDREMLLLTFRAAANDAFPGCDAVTVQFPDEAGVTVFPDTVQIAGVFEVNLISNPLVADAFKSNAPDKIALVDAVANVIDWFAFTSEIDREILVAAENEAFPGCDAVTVQVPAPLRVRVEPSTKQVSGVDDW